MISCLCFNVSGVIGCILLSSTAKGPSKDRQSAVKAPLSHRLKCDRRFSKYIFNLVKYRHHSSRYSPLCLCKIPYSKYVWYLCKKSVIFFLFWTSHWRLVADWSPTAKFNLGRTVFPLNESENLPNYLKFEIPI